ncbi:MAG: type II secretion system protein GspF [Gammaproteobacteria bacterium]|nr:MAG: type II secretion system protein GspF [Gammaproteobacteria bacterium]
MPAFEYIAVDTDGSEVTGSLEGNNDRHVRSLLREKELFPISVEEINKNTGLQKKISLSKSGFSGKELALFTRQLATLIDSGIPLDEAILSIHSQHKKQHLRNIILDIHSKIMEGHTLSEGFSEYPESFPITYRTTISAGEKSGDLGLILSRLANFIESKNRLQQQIKGALIYPAALIITSLLVISFMLTYVVPKVVYIFANFDQELPLITKIVINCSELIRNNYLIIFLALFLLVIFFKSLISREHFRRKYHELLIKIPIFGRLITISNSARYMQTLSTLSGSGVPILEALKFSAEVLNNLPMKEVALEAINRVSEGETISKSLSSENLFPSMMIYMIGSGENTGKLEEMLDKATTNQEEEFKSTVDTLLGILQPLTVVFMAIIVLLIVLAILLPIFEINNLIA